ncbi:MAG: beta-N-acetylhexosaminidase, partial [Thermoleophilia bacterium]|nr:beta-N-acetylhexosaminidase [Thermoleophilia bacterium]
LLAGLALVAGLTTGSSSTGFLFLADGGTTAAPDAAGSGEGATIAALGREIPRGLLAGQRIVAGFDGNAITAGLKKGIRKGRIGGVILFSDNIGSRSSLRSLTRGLQKIRRPGSLRRYPLLIMTDQEGGLVKRISGAPNASAAEMGRRGPGYSRNQGRLTGRNLHNAGINVDLAPVLDVARPGGEIDLTNRGFGGTAAKVAQTAVSFARGLQDQSVAATAKHFPGLGAASLNTDEAVQRIRLPKKSIRRIDEKPYRPYIDAGGRLVMVGTAIYPALGPKPAAFEKNIVTGELRRRLGFRGVAITDALGTVAARSFGGSRRVAIAAARAGTDMLLFTDYREALSGEDALTDRVVSGKLDRREFRRSVGRILRLRSDLGR